MSDSIIVEVDGVGELEFPDGTDPAVIQATVRRMVGGGESAPDKAPTLTRGGRDLDAIMAESDRLFGDGSGLVSAPLKAVGAAPGALAKAIGKIAPSLMRNSLGAQQSVRSKFPTVDLDKVALRVGAVPGSKASIGAVSNLNSAAGKAVRDTARAAGNGVVASADDVIRGDLQAMYREARTAKSPETQQAIIDHAKKVLSDYGPGLSMEGAQSRKVLLAQQGKAAMRSANPKEAAMGSQIANAERKTITSLMRKSPDMAKALDNSQAMIALEKAMRQTGNRTSILRDALATSAGIGAGAVAGGPAGAMLTAPIAIAANRAVTSPQLLGRAANLMHRTGQTGGSDRAAQALRALVADMIQTLNGQE